MKVFDALIDLIFPPSCAVCGKFGAEALCTECLAQTEYLPAASDEVLAPEACDEVRSAVIYDGVVKVAICKFKFKGRKTLKAPLSGILLKYLDSGSFGIDPDEIDVVGSVPLHQKRQRERGFDQSEALARSVAQALNKDYCQSMLLRVRDTKPQFDLKPAERHANVSGAFEVLNYSKVNGKRVLLIDDILTTGATVSECAKSLKNAGAKKVLVLTLSRAIEDLKSL